MGGGGGGQEEKRRNEVVGGFRRIYKGMGGEKELNGGGMIDNRRGGGQVMRERWRYGDTVWIGREAHRLGDDRVSVMNARRERGKWSRQRDGVN